MSQSYRPTPFSLDDNSAVNLEDTAKGKFGERLTPIAEFTAGARTSSLFLQTSAQILFGLRRDLPEIVS